MWRVKNVLRPGLARYGRMAHGSGRGAWESLAQVMCGRRFQQFGQHFWVPRGPYGHNHAGARASVALGFGAAVAVGTHGASLKT